MLGDLHLKTFGRKFQTATGYDTQRAAQKQTSKQEGSHSGGLASQNFGAQVSICNWL